jgi:DNA ligase-1
MITKPMLASKVELPKIVYPVLATPKYDGIRCLKVNGRALTRSFKPQPNLYVRQLIERMLPDGVDGELIVPGGTFQDTDSAFMTIKGEPRFEYHVFDYVAGSLEKPYCLRMTDLKSLEQLSISWLRIVLPVHVSDEAQLLEYEARLLKEGYEGVILRSPMSPYKCGRSTAREGYLLKLKRFEDAEAWVTGFEERMHNANPETKDAFGRAEHSSHKANMVPMGTLGALVVDRGDGVVFKIGTGFDDAQRKEIWANRHHYMSKLVKFKSQPTGVKEAPRFPVFLGWRHPSDT